MTTRSSSTTRRSDDHDDMGDALERASRDKTRKSSLLSSMRRRLAKPFTAEARSHMTVSLTDVLLLYRASAAAMRADRHSCLAAPYGASDPRTKQFFQVNISKARAPVVCANAGRLKGKAIYADRDLPKSTRIWTEAPYVAMQHAPSHKRVPCCQYCFVPLLGDYRAQWTTLAAAWNDRHQHQRRAMATPQDLDDVLAKLHVERRNCGLAAPAVTCMCGDTYCSKLCQLRAYHEFHAILCPRNDAFSAMSVFIRHTQDTNDIFLLAAKVIARVLSRFLVTQDLVKAREPMDMFHKKPWWEVVMMEKHVQRHSHSSDSTTTPNTSSDGSSSTRETSSPSGSSGTEHDSSNGSPQQQTANGHKDAMGDDGEEAENGDYVSTTLDGNGFDIPRNPLANASTETRFLKDLLVSTHQLLLDALESNFVHLEREDQLHGHRVDEVWTSCASILSFEFFAAQLGLFEMNNIQVEIDHPFRALMEVLDQGDDAEASTPNDAKDPELFERVRSVLEFGDEMLAREQLASLKRDGVAPDGDEEELIQSGLLEGYPSVDGTALFSIICTMNHSCDPNCTVLYTKNGDAHVVAVRDIAKGEELCICYIDVDQDVREREALLKEYQFKCLCPRCVFERRQLKDQKLVKEASRLAAASRLTGPNGLHVSSENGMATGRRSVSPAVPPQPAEAAVV